MRVRLYNPAKNMAGEFRDVGTLLAALKPDEPLYAFHFDFLKNGAWLFASHFHGEIAYDASANCSDEFLQAVHSGGIRQFAVTNLAELQAVKQLYPEAVCYFTHPVKSITAIREAAHHYGVTHFAIDHMDELSKVIVHTAPLKPTVIIRLAVPSSSARKFGCSTAEAATLMRAASTEGLGVGLGFNIDAPFPDIAMYREALEQIGSAIRMARLQPELIDVGGGFPDGCMFGDAPSLVDFWQAIQSRLSALNLHHPVRLLCAPGRTIAASGASLVVRVDLRRGHRLHLDDGIHGGLANLHFANRDPVLNAWRNNGEVSRLIAPLDDFIFCGPGMDNLDMLAGPFLLPSDIRTGDYIEIGQMGASGIAMRRDSHRFNSLPSVIVKNPGLTIRI